MLSAFVLAAAIFVLGARLSDGVRLRSEETILHKLSVAEAHAYYEKLKARARRTKLMRAVTLAAVLLVSIAVRKRLVRKAGEDAPAPVAEKAPARATLTANDAKRIAEEAAARQVGAGAALTLENVSSDERHPFVFDFRAGGEKVRVYVDGGGRAEVHKILE